MDTIFSKSTTDDLIARVELLSEHDTPHWGSMTPFQMVRHCVLSEQMYQGAKVYKRLFIGRLFGKIALKGILKDDAPMKQSQPTHPDMKIKGIGDFEKERNLWVDLLRGYQAFNDHSFIHPFFGKMTKEQIGEYVYKHTDHHLRQFGV